MMAQTQTQPIYRQIGAQTIYSGCESENDVASKQWLGVHPHSEHDASPLRELNIEL